MASGHRGEPIAAREYMHEYRVSGRRDLLGLLHDAVDASGARLLASTGHTRAPFHLGVALPDGRRLGALVYAFRVAHGGRNYPDEWKIQIRYGGEEGWHALDHQVGFDPAAVDVTALLGVDLDQHVLIGLDPTLYDPLPMGISIEYRQAAVDAALAHSWHVWERETRAGTRRAARHDDLETLVAFTPDRLVDYLTFEGEAQSLGLDHALRYRAAQRAAARNVNIRHELEDAFDLKAQEILDVIAEGHRLGTAVRGSVAEHHLHKALAADPRVRRVLPVHEDDRPDFDLDTDDHRGVLVEVKNCSPEPYADGTPKVEIQKTRGKVPDRLYEVGHFDVVAVCLWPVIDRWEFRYARVADLDRHPAHPNRLKSIHRIDNRWQPTLHAALVHRP